MKPCLSTLNETRGIGSSQPLSITAILKEGKVSIDGVQVDDVGPTELYSPIQCSNFVGPVSGVAFFADGPISPYALSIKYGDLAVTSASYEFGNAAGTVDPAAVEAQMIADYAGVGINIARLATIEDFLDGDYFDEDLVSNLWGPPCTEPCGNLDGANIKAAVPGNLSKATNSYYYLAGSHQRAFYLRNIMGTDLTYNGVVPGSTLSASYNPLEIWYWGASRKCIVKLS